MENYERLNALIENNALIIGLCAVVLLAIFSVKKKLKENKKKKIKELKIEKPEKANGIIFGKKNGKLVYSATNQESHVICVAGTGAGKTSAFGVPSLRSFCCNQNKGGNAFVIDISGDISKNVKTENKLVYDPEKEDTTPYNLFGMIDEIEDPDEVNEALSQLAYLLIPATAVSDVSKFYEDSGRKILMAVLISMYWAGMDFIEICEKVVSLSWQDLFAMIDEIGNVDGMMYINSFVGVPEQTVAGCKQSCDDAISLFATNAKVKRSIRRPKENEVSITPKEIEENSIYIIVDDPKLTLYSPLLNIITSQLMQYISNRTVTTESKTILLFLDEYASLKIEANIILEALRKYRKRKCRIMLMTQNLSDLNILYGEETTKALMANFKYKLLLGNIGELNSLKYFAELIGYKDKKKHSKSSNAKQVTYTENEVREYIIEPAELDRLGNDVAVLIHPENEGYMILKKNYYFKK